MKSSRFPRSPPWMKCLNLRVRNDPVGLLNLKGHRKLLTCLKLGPTVTNSWIRSSIQMIPYFPRCCSIIWLLSIGIRWPLILAYPRLYTSSLTLFRLGEPYVTYGSISCSIWEVARVILINVPLLICNNRNNWRIFRGLGAILLIPLIRITKASLASGST